MKNFIIIHDTQEGSYTITKTTYEGECLIRHCQKQGRSMVVYFRCVAETMAQSMDNAI